MQALRPRLLVELGTSHGVSYSAFCEAVLDARLPCRCYAVDHWHGDAHAGPAGEAVFQDLQAFNEQHHGAFSQLLREDFDSARERFADGSIDLLHIDGFHTYEAVRHDFEHWRPKLSARAVVLFHDTNVRRDDFGVHRLFAELAAAHPHFEFLHGHGLGVLAVGAQVPAAVRQLCAAAQDGETLTIRERFAALGARWEALAREEQARDSFERQILALQKAQQQALEEVSAKAHLGRDAVLAAQRERDSEHGRSYLLQTRLDEVQAERERLREEVRQLRTAPRRSQVEDLFQAQLRELLSRSEADRATALAQRDQLANELALSSQHHERARDWAAGLLNERHALVETQKRLQEHAAQVTALFGQVFARLLRRHEQIVGTVQPPARTASGIPRVSVARRVWRLVRPRQVPVGLRWLRPWLREKRASRHVIARVVRRSMLFDADWYTARYADVLACGMDPAYHYALFGGREGRDPSAWFSTRGYLALHSDVAATGLNALYHFEAFGMREGRALPSLVTSLASVATDTAGRNAFAFLHGPATALGHLPGVAASPVSLRPADSAQARQRYIEAADGALVRFLASPGRLAIGTSETPQVSVVMVLYNQVGLTYACLQALQAVVDIPFEVIVVDNASSDRTIRLLERLDGGRIFLQEENLHFLRAANLGARQAKGEHVLFLNNDTQVHPRSLGVASRLLDEMSDVGAVGGAIVLPDGTLQEAGSIVWSDGSCLGYGRGDDPEAAAYAFRRDVDYCSGAFLMVRRSVFERLGGFDPLFAPAYYEDTDLCMRMRAAGFRVIYEPQVRLLHAESASAPSADATSNLIRVNQAQFVRRHGHALAEHRPAGEYPVAAAMRLSAGRRLLFVDDCVPDPTLGSGNPRAAELLRCLHELGVHVTHCPLAQTEQDARAAAGWLPPTAELAAGGPPALQRLVVERADFYDGVIVSRPHNMVHWHAAVARSSAWSSATPVIYDAEAIFAQRDVLRRRVLGGAHGADGAVSEELALAGDARAVLVVSEAEAAQFRRAGARDVRLLGHSLACHPEEVCFESRRHLLFVGRLAEQDSPNADSVRWFLREVMPRLDALIGQGYVLDVVGWCDPSLQNSLQGPRVRFHGRVQDLGPLYAQARVFIAPTRFAAGMPMKVHEAAAHGLPVVATSLLAEQLGWNDGLELLVADGADAFAAACARAYTDAALWERLRTEALRRVGVDCDPARFRDEVRALVRQFLPAATATADVHVSDARQEDVKRARTAQAWSIPPEQRAQEQGLFWMTHPLVVRRLNEKASGMPGRDGMGHLRAHLEAMGWCLPLARVASLGCGFGALERGLASQGWAQRVDGYDLAEAALEAARRDAAAAGLAGIHYHRCDLEHEDLPEGVFDLVIGSHSVHHIDNLDGLFDRVRRALRTGGVFYLQEFVGPDRFQWTDAQLDAINEFLPTLPKRLRLTPSGYDLSCVKRPTIAAVMAVDPSEAVRSSDILPALARHFEILDRRDLGGALLQTGLSGIAQNFDPASVEDAAHLQRLFALEDRLMAQGVIGSDFVNVIAVRGEADDGR